MRVLGYVRVSTQRRAIARQTIVVLMPMRPRKDLQISLFG
jgi:hypothetical protein